MQQAGLAKAPAYWCYRWFWESLDWLYPPACGGCGKQGFRWCAECRSSLKLITPPFCDKCGLPTRKQDQLICSHCRQETPAFEGLRSWGEFDGPLRNALIRLKYKKDVALGEILSRQLMAWFTGLKWDVDLVTPVPLSPARLRQRGYNQVAHLAKPFALGLGLAYQPGALKMPRDRRTQVGLGRPERRSNVAGAFCANRKLVNGKIILLVDDTATTGATLDECTHTLLSAGARRVYAITAARAVQM